MHSTVQTAVVTIISYKPLSGLNFARYTGQYGRYMPSSPLGVYKPLPIPNAQCNMHTNTIYSSSLTASPDGRGECLDVGVCPLDGCCKIQ